MNSSSYVESGRVFEVSYLGVHEAKSSSLKHCQEAVQYLVSRVKKDERKMKNCTAKVFNSGMEIHFPPESNHDSMRIPTHFMQVAGIDSYYRKVSFLSVSGKRQTKSGDKVGVFCFYCGTEPLAEEFVTAISLAFKNDYQNWQNRMQIQNRIEESKPKSNLKQRPMSEIVGEKASPVLLRHTSLSVSSHPKNHHHHNNNKNNNNNNVNAYVAHHPVLAKEASQPARNISNELKSWVPRRQNYEVAAESQSHRLHPGIAQKELEVPDNQLPVDVVRELQERLKRMKKDDEDEERVEAFTLRSKTRKYPHLITDN